MSFTEPRRFEAPSSREALRLVREQLGPDALVLSSHVTATGVAIVAVVEGVQAPVGQETVLPSASVPQSEEIAPLRLFHPVQPTQSLSLSLSHCQPAPIELSPGLDPLRVQLLRVLLGAGFSPGLARSTLAGLPPDPAQDDAQPSARRVDEGMAWLKSTLVGQLPALGSDDELLDAGGVYALVGPTGVGKTTTTAKLAARYVMRAGAGRLALVTTDTFRIGAVEQLRLYGEILGVPVYAVRNGAELDGLLTQLRGKHMVLIDTVGMSQRDRAVADQIAMLSATRRPVQRLLLLNAAAQGETLDEVIRAYQPAGEAGQGAALAGCIFTKVDEAAHVGALVDVAIRQQLKVHYVANGQRVPEHLLLARAEALVDSVLAVRAPSAWVDTQALEMQPLAPRAAEADLRRRLQAQCDQLLRALSHDTQELAQIAQALRAAPVGFAATRALWRQATHGASVGVSAVDEHELRRGRWLLALTDMPAGDTAGDTAGHAAGQVVALSMRDGTPLAALGPATGFNPEREQQPLVHLLAKLPARSQMQGWAEAGVMWAARADASLRVGSAQPGPDSSPSVTLSRLMRSASFGPARALQFRRETAWVALAEVQVCWPDDSASAADAASPASQRLRCVIERISDAHGRPLRHRYVVAPVALDVPAEQLVQWPVWRTQAQANFKRLSLGLQAQQLPVDDAAAQAHWRTQAGCTVLRLQCSDAAGAQAARKLLAQLAGRSVRAGQPVSGPVLLDGLVRFMALLDALEPEGDEPIEVEVEVEAQMTTALDEKKVPARVD